MIKRFLHALTLISMAFSVLAQPEGGIGGKVVNHEKGEALPFAQVALGNSATGTVSNEEGQFFLQLPPGHEKDTVYISYLGYEMARLAVSGLHNRENLIRLKLKEVLLKEVEVVALTPQEVLRRAFGQITENYRNDSILLTAFYRSQKFAGKKLAEFAEAVIVDLKTGYFTQNSFKDVKDATSGNNLTHLVKGRVVSDTGLVNSMGDVGKAAGCLGCIFVDPVQINYRSVFDEEVFRFYSLKMEEISGPGGGRVFHIWYEQQGKDLKGYKGEIYIDGSSFAVMRISQKPSFKAFDKYEKEKYKKTYTINGKPGWIAEMPLIDRTVAYDLNNDGWHLSTVREEQWVTFTLPATGQKIRMGYKNELVVTATSRDAGELKMFRGDRQSGAGQRWDQLVGNADPDFWAKYNYLPVEESLRSAIQGIGK